MQMNCVVRKYEVPMIERYEVYVETGYGTSVNVELPEIDGSKEEGEW